MTANVKQRRQQVPQLKVVFDTNVLFTDSASDLLRQEVAKLVQESKFPDLEIQWYLPEMVRHERQFQMQKKALLLLPHIGKVERLLGHNLAINEQVLTDGVQKVVSQRLEELGLSSLTLDVGKVNWQALALDAVYRRPPFQDGETEKGFRDRIIVECFLQLVEESPKTPTVCRVVLVSGDGLVAQAVKARTAESTNTQVLTSMEDLKGLINTLVSQVGEDLLAILKPKAEKLFFTPDDKTSLLFRFDIVQKIKNDFANELVARPAGTTGRTNGTWTVNKPNFVKKMGRRVHWTSRIEIETEATKTVSYKSTFSPTQAESRPSNIGQFARVTGVSGGWDAYRGLGFESTPLSILANPVTTLNLQQPSSVYAGLPNKVITTYTGIDVYEVLWSADVTTKRELRRPTIDEIKHGEPTWEQDT